MTRKKQLGRYGVRSCGGQQGTPHFLTLERKEAHDVPLVPQRWKEAKYTAWHKQRSSSIAHARSPFLQLFHPFSLHRHRRPAFLVGSPAAAECREMQGSGCTKSWLATESRDGSKDTSSGFWWRCTLHLKVFAWIAGVLFPSLKPRILPPATSTVVMAERSKAQR